MSHQPKKSHSENLLGSCLVCCKKADRQVFNQKKLFSYITENLIKNYENVKQFLPSGVCSTCRLKEVSKIKWPEYSDWLDILSKIPVDTMSSPECQCFVCVSAKAKIRHKFKGKKSRPRSSSPLPTSPKINRSKKVQNFMETWSPKSRKMAASETIRDEQKKKSSGSPVRLPSASGGPNMPVIMGTGAIKKVQKEAKESVQVPLETFVDMGKDKNRSKNDILKIAKVFRKQMGRKSIESGLSEALIANGKSLEEHFTVKTLTLKARNKQKELVDVEKPVILCKNLPKFIAHVMSERELENCTIKIGIDSGQGSFKICLTLLEAACDDLMDLSVCLENEKQSSENSTMGSPPSKRSKSSSSQSKSRKPGSVKQLFIIGICKGLPELYDNFKIFFDELGLQGLQYCLAADFQAINIPLGLQGFSATYCCPYCVKKKPWDRNVSADKRTLGRIRKMCREFRAKLESGEASWDDAKNYENCVNLPLFDGPDDTYILDLIPIPELHLLLGITNKILALLNDKWSKISGVENRAYKWCDENNIHRLEYRGKDLNGPACKLLLDKKLQRLRLDLPRCLRHFVLVFRAFDQVRSSCFSEELIPSYKNDIINFGNLYCDLKTAENKPVAIIPKIHILLDHVPEFCESRNRGLGFYNEQASEAVHHAFKEIWINYKINNEDHPKFQGNLLSATLEFNQRNM